MEGLLTRALAIATRCLCPPESSFGLWAIRSDSPTCSRVSIAIFSLSIFGMPAYINGKVTFSRAVYLGRRLNVWKTNPISLFLISARKSSSILLTSVPLSIYTPLVGVSRQPTRFMSVDLPEPDGPIIATYSFFLISTETDLKACTITDPTW